jgi:hypothetical protein
MRWGCWSGMKVVRILSDRPTERVKHSNGKTVSESIHLISVTICTTLVFGNLKLNFYDPNMMNHYSTQNILSVSESDARIHIEKEKLIVSVSAVSVRIRSVFMTSPMK